MSLEPTFRAHVADRGLTGSASDGLQLVFLDQALSQLVPPLQSRSASATEFIILDTQTDGMAQISATLQQRQNVSAIHILSHGDAGQLQLGNLTLSADNLNQYVTQLKAWDAHLTADADILLYGCNVGAGDRGVAFLQQFQQFTQADIAASIDLTGNINLGGNWELEVQLGTIGTAAFALTDYAGLLPIYQGHEYLLTTNLSWTASQAEAVRLGGNLVTLNDAAEETWLRQTYGAEKLWIGLTDQVTEGNYQWISGEVSAYRNWTPGEPNNSGNEDWIEMNFDATGRWNDEKVGATRRGIVEINTAITPPPSPTPTPPPPSPTPTPPPPSGIGNGLTAEYYDNADFTNLKLTRVDANVNFNWGAGSPDATIAPDSFSARWSGQVLAQYSEAYTFYTTGDDGIRLSVNGTQIINGWKDQPATEYNGTITLVAGQKYNIQLEYFENGGSAVSQLAWSSTSQAKQIIPQAQLFTAVIAPPPPSPTPTPPPPSPTPTPPPAGTGNGLMAQYYDNADFTNLKLTRVDANVNFNWGAGSPDVTIAPDSFSARWSGQVLAQYAEEYTFYTTGDDGIRLSVNGIQIINGWKDQPATEYSGKITLAAGQKYNIQLEYFENGGSAVSQLAWSSISQAKQIIPQAQLFSTVIAPPPPSPTPTPPPPSPTPTPPPPAGTGDGLKAEYYDNNDFTNLKVTRVDPSVNFNWGNGSPDATIGVDTFSARWSGQVLAQYSETYTFYTTGDDGIRLSVNGTQIINGWKDQPATEYNGTITLVAGQKYRIQLEYFENGGSAVSQLAWSSTSQVKQIIPQAQLFSSDATLPPTIALEGSVYTVNETDAKVDIAIVRSGNTQGVSTIDYRADSGTAISGDDFTASSGTVSFAAGETRKIISIPIVDDTLVEGNEAFSFVVQVPTGANLGTLRTATITLFDNESSALTVNPIQVNENIGTAIVTLVRGNSNVAASIDYSTSNGTAIAVGDYTTTIGTVNFAIGEPRKTISIPIVNDTIAESNETFQVNFSNPVGLTLTNNSTTITISDDDSTTLIRETVTSGLVQPTAFAWTPGEALMFIAQKNGVVRVSKNNALVGNFIDLSAEVNDVRDRGLLGIAVHPEFYTGKPYVYLAYSYDPPEAKTTGTTLDARDQTGNRAMRVVRITADAANNYRTAVAGSEFVIVGKNSIWANISHPELNSTGDYTIAESGRTAASPNAPGGYVNDYIKIDSESHMGGHLAFGADGALYISTGDGTSYNAPDPRTISVQSLDSLSGKILRVDPLTGEGLVDNPFYTNDVNSNRAKVWDLGLRNPFRFTIAPGTSTPFIGDVGYFTWEEVNVGARGANFGWPGYEGGYVGSDRYTLSSQVQTNYKNSVPAVATFVNSNPQVTAPIFARSHGADGAQAIVMGDFFRGELIVTDVNQGTVEALTLNAQNQVTAIRRFDSASVPGIVYMDASLDGGLYYVDLIQGAIGRWKSA